jgi:hypothetical protein
MPTSTVPSPARPSRLDAEQRARGWITLVFGVVGAFLLFALAYAFLQPGDPSPYDDTLPNPMGGPARTAPGELSGSASLGGLEIEDTEVAMGRVGLGVTYVPTWTVTNPTAAPVSITTGQPQVLEGCCPGPVYADDAEVLPGDAIEVPASGSVELAFPLQMHPGMDGPHHLTVPLATADGAERTEVHVTGDFTADAPA